MKSVYIALTFALLAAVMPHSSHAQLLKNLVNNMTKNIGNKGTTTSGKPDSSKKSLMGYDSASMAQLMANANRNNNKPKISPADSAAAIKSFMTGTGGSGIGYQYSISYTFARKNLKDSTMKDTMQLALTDGHNTRTDMGLLGSKFAVIGHAGSPRYSVMLYSASKTFQFNIIDTAGLNYAGGMNYTVIKIGNETVQGYNCIHSRMTTITPGSKTNIVQDIWTSNDVPGYSTLKKMISVQSVTPKMMQVLDAAGAGGMFVKMTMTTKEMSMDMVLISAGRKSFPDSMFEIPSGYTQTNNWNLFGNMMPQQKPAH